MGLLVLLELQARTAWIIAAIGAIGATASVLSNLWEIRTKVIVPAITRARMFLTRGKRWRESVDSKLDQLATAPVVRSAPSLKPTIEHMGLRWRQSDLRDKNVAYCNLCFSANRLIAVDVDRNREQRLAWLTCLHDDHGKYGKIFSRPLQEFEAFENVKTPDLSNLDNKANA